ncbi:helix-turn-helix domain-containing protein [Acidocella aquatica]|uniref:helix-turn-helix domain-containing protein n=1 Tax=Acidocella aquatica TaxID=1922313 RepID=UPI0024E190A9|nr:helix-turn-helix domain-containing protein [Acidocella aquatica]
MATLHELSEFRRPLPINLANRPTASNCDDCGARHSGLCNALTDDELEFLTRAAQRVSLAPGTVFVEEGEKASYFYNINQGNVRLFKSLPDGRRQITGFAGPGYFLGLAAGENNAFSAEAMDHVKLCRFSRASLMAVFEELPVLERKLLDVAMHELVLAQQQMLLLGRKTAIERIASFLLAWAERLEICPAGRLPAPNAVMKLPLSRTDLADYLGLTIETVSRSLSQLKRDGIIDIPNIHEIILTRPRALSEIAEAAV